MRRQQLRQRLDGEEEEKTADSRSADQEQEEKDAVSIDQLRILGLYLFFFPQKNMYNRLCYELSY